jgi:plasmid stability protein
MAEPKQITVRNPPPELTRRLRAVAESRGESINTTVIRLLQDALGVDERRHRLARYATWTEADQREFDDAHALQRTVDDDLWR